MKCYESKSNIATILYINNGYARKPEHMKKLRNPQFCNASMVELSFKATWSFSTFSYSFHSNISLSFQISNKFPIRLFAKNHTFTHQHTWPSEIECWNVSLTLDTCIDDTLVTLLGRVATQSTLVSLQCDYSIIPTRSQHDPTMSSLRW